MTELINYLSEKNISVKDFAKITKIKTKRLNMILNNQAYFNNKEMEVVSAFLGVSKNELFHGVTERKGELYEVTEQNNLNHFRYYLKNRFKTRKNIHRFLEALLGFFGGGLLVFYVVLMFIGISGLPTILRSFDVMIFCLIMPLIGMCWIQDFSFEKIYKKKSVKENNLKKESIAFSAIVLLFGTVSFVNEFIPLTVFIFLLLSAISQILLSVTSVLKNKAFINGLVRFGLYAVPTILMLAASGLLEGFLDKNVPDDIMSSSSNAVAMVIIGLMLFWLIFASFIFALKQMDNVFIEGVGNLVSPMKKEKTITKKRMAVSFAIYGLFVCLVFVGISASQGLYLKYMYTAMFEGQEETVNWTAEYITDYETRYKKGEYDVVKYKGNKIEVPVGYKLNRKTDEKITYKKGENSHLMLSTLHYDEKSLGLFDNDYGEDKITEKQKQELKEDFIKYFGVYPTTMYEWQKLYGSITLDDVNILNPKKTALMLSIFAMKSICTVPDSEYYLYENGELYATILIHTINNKEKGTTNELVDICFGSTDLEYNITLIRPAEKGDGALEDAIRILNSINLD